MKRNSMLKAMQQNGNAEVARARNVAIRIDGHGRHAAILLADVLELMTQANLNRVDTRAALDAAIALLPTLNLPEKPDHVIGFGEDNY